VTQSSTTCWLPGAVGSAPGAAWCPVVPSGRRTRAADQERGPSTGTQRAGR
jgi:hypothetical protein